jgi:hypothetical protein
MTERGTAWGTTKEVAGQQRSLEKLRPQRKTLNSSKLHPSSPGNEGETKATITNEPDTLGDRLAILTAG